MFGEPLFFASRHARGETLRCVVNYRHIWAALCNLGTREALSHHILFEVAAYITAAYWFTASASFDNPAVSARLERTKTRQL
jgi:hypothetical protein